MHAIVCFHTYFEEREHSLKSTSLSNLLLNKREHIEVGAIVPSLVTKRNLSTNQAHQISRCIYS